MTRWQPQAWMVYLALAVLSAGLYVAFSRQAGGVGFPLDDAWIHQVYARSLGEHGELAFETTTTRPVKPRLSLLDQINFGNIRIDLDTPITLSNFADALFAASAAAAAAAATSATSTALPVMAPQQMVHNP